MSAGTMTAVESAAVVDNTDWQQLMPPNSGESSESSSGCEDGRLINCRTLPLFNYTDLAPPLVGGGTSNVNSDILQDDNCPSVLPSYDNKCVLSRYYCHDDNAAENLLSFLCEKTIDGYNSDRNDYDNSFDNDNNIDNDNSLVNDNNSDNDNNNDNYSVTKTGVRDEQRKNADFSLEYGYHLRYGLAFCLLLSLLLYLLIKCNNLYYLLLLTLLLLFIVIVYFLLLMLLLSYVTVIVFTVIIVVHYCRR